MPGPRITDPLGGSERGEVEGGFFFFFSRISRNRNRQCSGNSMVSATVSTIHPKRTLRVAHLASPLASLLSEIGSLRCALSVGELGRRISSIE